MKEFPQKARLWSARFGASLLVAGFWLVAVWAAPLLVRHTCPRRQVAGLVMQQRVSLYYDTPREAYTRDPWGKSWRYLRSGEVGLYSCGPNGIDEATGGDDIRPTYAEISLVNFLLVARLRELLMWLAAIMFASVGGGVAARQATARWVPAAAAVSACAIWAGAAVRLVYSLGEAPAYRYSQARADLSYLKRLQGSADDAWIGMGGASSALLLGLMFGMSILYLCVFLRMRRGALKSN
jgi:hypothetical protein